MQLKLKRQKKEMMELGVLLKTFTKEIIQEALVY